MKQETEIIPFNPTEFKSILKNSKWLIISITSIVTIIGLVYSLILKNEYKSEGKILPEIQSKSGSLGQFAGLAALAGVDINNPGTGTDAIRPDLYPDVLKTTPFFLNLFKEIVRDRRNNVMTFQEFYNSQVLNGKLNQQDQKNIYRESKNYLSFNRQTEKNILDLKKRIICNYDKKSGVIAITVKMPDPIVAALITRFSMDYLTTYIIEYRTEKLRRDLEFLENRLANAKGKYFSSQNKKAIYTDQMPLTAIRSQSADLQRERIDFEYKTSSSFYNTLLQKYEEAKLKMQQETPVIKVLEPPVVSNTKVEPKRSIIIILSFFGGLLMSVLFVSIRKSNLKKILSS